MEELLILAPIILSGYVKIGTYLLIFFVVIYFASLYLHPFKVRLSIEELLKICVALLLLWPVMLIAMIAKSEKWGM